MDTFMIHIAKILRPETKIPDTLCQQVVVKSRTEKQ